MEGKRKLTGLFR